MLVWQIISTLESSARKSARQLCMRLLKTRIENNKLFFKNSKLKILDLPDTVNPIFQMKLNQTLHQFVHEDPYYQALAANQKSGFLNIIDQRSPFIWGRVNDPEDIFGVVRLDGKGNMVKNSFEPMPTHRIMSRDGLFQLTEYLQEKLIQEIKD